MNTRRLMSTIQTVDWSWSLLREGEWDRRASTRGQIWLDDQRGVIHSMCRPQRPSVRRLPIFEREIRRWRRFLKHHPVNHFDLGFKRRRIHAPGSAPGCFVDTEWRIGIDRDTTSLGRLLLSWSSPTKLPPNRFLMDYLRLLIAVPRVRAVRELAEPIVFRGDLLVHLLAGGLERACYLLAEHGRWSDAGTERVSLVLPTRKMDQKSVEESRPGSERVAPRFRPSEELVSEEGDRVEGNIRPWLPVRRRFLPNAFGSLPPEAWRALFYRSDDRILICHHPRKGFATFALAVPLHRTMAQFIFEPRYRAVTVKGIAYEVPDGCFLP